MASGLPGDPTRVSGVVNPNKEQAYQGPTAAVHGRVRAAGDAPVAVAAKALSAIPAECAKALR